MVLQAFKTGGERGVLSKESERTLQTLKQPGSESVDPAGVASAYALAGDKDSAFKWLDKAYADRDGQDIPDLPISCAAWACPNRWWTSPYYLPGAAAAFRSSADFLRSSTVLESIW
jgi:hypothetical protein